jgi:hypothetical protein
MYIPQQILAPFPASTTQSVQRPLAVGCATVFGLAEQTWPLRTNHLQPPPAPTTSEAASTS